MRAATPWPQRGGETVVEIRRELRVAWTTAPRVATFVSAAGGNTGRNPAKCMATDSPFSSLSAADLGAIARHGIERSYLKNVIVVQEGDQSDSFYLIRSGSVKVFLSRADGKQVTLGTQGAGEFFGELALLDESPRSASVVTLEPCEMTVVSGADFRRCLETDPELAGRLIRLLAKRVRELTESVKVLALCDVYGRVRAALLSRARAVDGELEVTERLTHQEIANCIGSSREAVSRVMKELARGGLIQTTGQRIRILRDLPEKF